MTDRKRKTLKYFDKYLSYGFAEKNNGGEPIPYCIICKKEFSNSSMNSFNMKRHLDSQHENYKDKDLLFFERFMEENENKEVVSVTNKYVSASYHLSYQIAKTGNFLFILDVLFKSN
jgi:hypothetical protein